VSRINAALALQLANSFLSQKRPELLHKLDNCPSENSGNGISMSVLPFHLQGLKSTIWKGRFQVLN